MTCTNIKELKPFAIEELAETMPREGKFELIELPYASNALAPVISNTTLALHHDKHLQTYVNNLNAALDGSPFENLSLEEVAAKATGGLQNNAGQTLNHNLYFRQLAAPNSFRKPKGKLAEAINSKFGSLEEFKKEFTRRGTTLFGSGWVWLASDSAGNLLILQEPNAANPVKHGLRPLLCFDVWEHAYYMDYQNMRAAHLEAMWQIVNWDVVEERYK